MQTAIHATRWPGRQHFYSGGGVNWYLDGAHTVESIETITTWFKADTDSILIFYCSPDRDWKALLAPLTTKFAFKQIHFVSPRSASPRMFGHPAIRFEEFALPTSGTVLVTGSLHLVGDFLDALNINVDSL